MTELETKAKQLAKLCLELSACNQMLDDFDSGTLVRYGSKLRQLENDIEKLSFDIIDTIVI